MFCTSNRYVNTHFNFIKIDFLLIYQAMFILPIEAFILKELAFPTNTLKNDNGGARFQIKLL
jgi:hypothetical protein